MYLRSGLRGRDELIELRYRVAESVHERKRSYEKAAAGRPSALCAGSPGIDSSDAASALHHAVRAARAEFPRAPSLWAAYMHAGT